MPSPSGKAAISNLPEPAVISLRQFADGRLEGAMAGDAGRTDAIATPDSPVRVASISKLAVALAVMRLVEAGRLDLDRDVGEYLGWRPRNPAFPQTAITLRMLLSHTASLTDRAEYILPLDGKLDVLLANPLAWQADHAPGSGHFEYANVASPIIAAVMEGATAKRFDVIMRDELFGPAGIDACFNWRGCQSDRRSAAITLLRSNGDLAKDPPLAADEAKAECVFVPASDGSCDIARYMLARNGSAFSPQGGLRASANDLLKLGQLIQRRDPDFLSPQCWDEMTRAQWRNNGSNSAAGEGEWASAWGLGIAHQPGGWIGHEGDAYGLRAGLWINKASGEIRVNITTMVGDDLPVGPCLDKCP